MVVNLREALAAGGCTMHSVRVPLLRLNALFAQGSIDAIADEADLTTASRFAVPLDQAGGPDTSRALSIYTVVFVRANDHLPADTDPASYFRSHRLGISLGASFVAPLREAGLIIDEGAVNIHRNLEKLRRGRVDGFALAAVVPSDIDATVSAQYGKQFVRLEKPLRAHRVWLLYTKAYCAANSGHNQQRMTVLVKKYGQVP